MEIYVVSWAAIDPSNINATSSGTFSDIFRERKDARKAVMDDIKACAESDLDMYDTKEDRLAALGASTPAALAKKMIKVDQGDFIVTEDEKGIIGQYSITKYDTKYAV